MSVNIGDRVRMRVSDLEGVVVGHSDSGATIRVRWEDGRTERHAANWLLPCDPEKAPENTEPVRLLARRVYSALRWSAEREPTFKDLTESVDVLIEHFEKKEAELRTVKEKLAAIESTLRS